MEASELRMGNYVEYCRNPLVYELKQIKGIDYGGEGLFIQYYSQDGSQYPINIKNLNAIPLTEDWLLKFGFEKKGNEYLIWKDNDPLGIEVVFWKFKEFYVNLVSPEYNHELKNVKYVHQLQNLYFALTNKELKRKE